MKKVISAKTFIAVSLAVWLLCLVCVTGFTVFIDPFLHFHGPLSFLQYPLKEERYTNDGISRHYDYEAIITGTSVAQNFKASEVKELWGLDAIKICFSSGTYKEVGDAVERALAYSPETKLVIRSLDPKLLISGKDEMAYGEIPVYLYDENPFNDVSYVWNKEVLPYTIAVLNYTRAGNKTTDMDNYGAWWQYAVYGRDQVLKGMLAEYPLLIDDHLSEETKSIILENVIQNIGNIAKNHPDVTFDLFIPPYSLADWYALTCMNQYSAVEAEKLAVSTLLQEENIHVFAFADHTEITADLDNYMDTIHFGPWISSQILDFIHEGTGELTLDNLDSYYDKVWNLYQNYPYDF